MKVYISGPITNAPGYMDKFEYAEAIWKDKGVYVINPARTNATLPEETDHDGYMRVSIALLSECDTIYMLKGWEMSDGAREELDFAASNSYTILFQDHFEKHPEDLKEYPA